MRRRSYSIGAVLFALAALAGAGVLALREGLLPAALNPVPGIDLAVARPWFLDWRLARLRGDRDACAAVLREPHVSAQPIADQPFKNGCGIATGVRLAKAGGARLVSDKVTCEMAAALTLWIEHTVQPAAVEILGQRIAGFGHMGTYACRNIVGSVYLKGIRSEHASANAIDIASFTLADGRQVAIKQHWATSGREAQFLRQVHAGACRYFRVAIGPDFNAQHADHFHLDRGLVQTCR